ncbi:MAG TPA: site-specific integrase, partial [Pseudoxanthomonas sp.]
MSARTPAERRTRAMTMPPVPETDAAAIAAFLDAIWAESGLGKQSQASYRSDLEGFARWRNIAQDGLANADRAVLFDYLAWRTQQGYSPRSNARLLSSLRAFFAHRLRRGDRHDDPTALLAPPKLPRSLPKALSETEIDALLAAPPLNTPLGLR